MIRQKIIIQLKSYSKKTFTYFAIISVIVFIGTISPAKAETKPSLVAHSAIAIDANSGQILYQKDANKPLPIASVTKLLSIYIILEQIKSGQLTWNTSVKIDPATAKLSRKPELTNVQLVTGHKYSVRQLYKASLIYSANAAVTALGTKVSGSPQKFLSKMRQTALKLGITSAKIVTASGITNGQAGRQLGDSKVGTNVENEMSALDVSKLAKRLVTDFPSVIKTTKIRSSLFDSGGISQKSMINWNMMLKGARQYTSNLPVDGIKTGTSTEAGGNFVGTVDKHGHRIITVVMHAGNGNIGDDTRFVQTRHLMNWIYDTYRPVKLATGYGVSDADNAPTFYGKSKTVSVTLARPVTLWLTKNQTKSSVTGELRLDKNATEKGGLEAPIIKNNIIGGVSLKIDDRKVASVTGSITAPVKASQNDYRANWFVRIWRDVGTLFWYAISKLLLCIKIILDIT